MVKQNFLTKMLLLCALIVGSVSSAWAEEVTLTVSTYATANSWVDATAYSTISINSDLTATCVTGGNNGKYYVKNDSWRHYEGDNGAITITTTSGTLNSITFNYDKNNNGVLIYNSTNYVTGAKCDKVSGKTSATFSVGRSSGTKAGNVQITSIVVDYTPSASGLTSSDLSLTNSPIALSFDLYNNSSAQTISYTTSSTGAITVSASDYVTTSVNTTNKTITVTPNNAVTPEAQTITVNQAADETYAAGSVTFTVTITNSDPNVPGTLNNPYTVAQAIDATPSNGTSENVYIKGIVSKFQNTSIVGDGSNYRYYISDDGTTTNQLLVYRGKGLNNVEFSNAGDLLLGDEVVIYGGLTTYNNTKEVAAGNYIVSLNRKELVSIALSGNYTTTFVEGSEFNHEGVIVTATYNDNSTAVVTADATFSEPDMTQIGQQEVTVTYNGKETSYNITITAIPTHTVTFSINGTETTEDFKEGASIEFPDDPSAIEGKVFVGWVTTPIDGTTDSEPTLVTSAIMGDADIVYYATFATETGTPLVFSKYEKVTTAPADWSGTYLLGATYTGGSSEDNKGTFVFSGFAATYGNREKLTPGTTEYTDYEIVIEKVDEHYTLHHTKSNMYFSYTGSSNNMYSADKVNGDSEKWNIDADGIITNVNITNRMIRYNGSSPRFSCYTQGQTATDLYKRIETGGFEYSGYCTTVPTTSITITPNKEYVSFSSPYPLDFTNTTGLTAYVVSDETSTSVTLTEVNKVPANTGLVLKGTANTEYTVPVLSGDAGTFTNKLKGTGTEGVTGLTPKSVYVLSDGKFKVYTGTEIAGGKAYLPKTSEAQAPSLSFDFGEGTTGIQNIERTINDNQYYTLDGRRVAQPTKGLYIVNGKKVVIK